MKADFHFNIVLLLSLIVEYCLSLRSLDLSSGCVKWKLNGVEPNQALADNMTLKGQSNESLAAPVFCSAHAADFG